MATAKNADGHKSENILNNNEVVLAEKSFIGSGATGYSAGMLVTEIEGESLSGLVASIGKHKAELYWRAQSEALNSLRSIILKENINCDMGDERLYILGHGNKNAELVSEDEKARKSAHLLSRNFIGESLMKHIGTAYYDKGEEVHPGISVNPLKAVQGIAEAASRYGVSVFEQTEIVSIDLKKKIAYTAHGKILYETLVLGKDSFLDSKHMNRYETTCVVTKPLTDAVLHSLHMNNHFMYIENQLTSYHYVKMADNGRLLIGLGDKKVASGIHHPKLIESHLVNAKNYLKKVFPDNDIEIEYAWSGVYGLNTERLPLLEYDKEHSVFTYGGAGTQVATVAISRLIADIILEKNNSIKQIFF